MSYLANINKLSLSQNSINSVFMKCAKKPFSMPCHINLKSSYHLNTSNLLTISNALSSEKLNFNLCSVNNYSTRQ